MRDSLPRPFSSHWSSQSSLLHRIRENFLQIVAGTPTLPSTANGAPIHVMRWRHAPDASRSRMISFLAHVALISGLLFLHVQSGTQRSLGGGKETVHSGVHRLLPFPGRSASSEPSLGLKGGGGENDPRPTRHGVPAPGSSMPLLPPRVVVNRAPELPVPPSVFDPNAPQIPAVVTNLGLPWMKDDSNSAGPGKNHGFGTGNNGGMGDDEGPGAGQGESYRPHANAVTLPTCAYCPDPQYTDEAREAKLQGKVTLRVLVGADGRAAQIQIVQGIGLGLDDRAVQSVHTWRFVPAHDAASRAVPQWVNIEVIFRLI